MLTATVYPPFTGGERDALLEHFRSGKSKVLITTNDVARGIDSSAAPMVINYAIPLKGRGDSQPYSVDHLHRMGPSGRAGRSGVKYIQDNFLET
ncbi:hypothetical protein jhhlp_006753 [Lomentospora prolificans]|uniref:Helicase C-terminal domain-containing protein n=1 Tax=Lomentospora prolificans TaxID=41688 RepID=A0A2N3N368_9PEZI|nr:hypothetical protein jhhlp_006753 [Lomentospora prolificans]